MKDTGAEVAFERRTREVNKEEWDGRLKVLEVKMAGTGGNNLGGDGDGGLGITNVVSDIECKFKDVERKEVEKYVQ